MFLLPAVSLHLAATIFVDEDPHHYSPSEDGS